MHKLLTIFAVALTIITVSTKRSEATIRETVHLDFESVGVFDGTLTFNDGYQGLTDAAGLLTGGSKSYNNTISWSWWEGKGYTNPSDSSGDGYYNDFLMSGVKPSFDIYRNNLGRRVINNGRRIDVKTPYKPLILWNF